MVVLPSGGGPRRSDTSRGSGLSSGTAHAGTSVAPAGQDILNGYGPPEGPGILPAIPAVAPAVRPPHKLQQHATRASRMDEHLEPVLGGAEWLVAAGGEPLERGLDVVHQERHVVHP